MKVFVTGGTGSIGSAVTRALEEGGHEVVGLVRSERSAERLSELGGRPVAGDLSDPRAYLQAARGCDALIHMAADRQGDRVSADRTAIEAFLTAAEGDEGPEAVIYTSGCWILGDTGPGGADESAPPDPAEVVAWRPDHERRVLGASNQRLATAVLRPGMVYGGREEDDGIVSDLFRTARDGGASRHVGDGRNRWSLVHRDDLARLYRMLVENRARGVFHGTDDAATRVADLAEAASRAAGAGGETEAVSVEQAREEMGAVADALRLDQVIRSPRSRALGWSPSHPPFLEHVDAVYREWLGA